MFYVYDYLRGTDNIPYYIGKGIEYRYIGSRNLSVPKEWWKNRKEIK